MTDRNVTPPFLWSVRVRRFWQPWEAWVENESGRVVRSTLDYAWSREAAERKTRRRWQRLMKNRDVDGTLSGAPVNYKPDQEEPS